MYKENNDKHDEEEKELRSLYEKMDQYEINNRKLLNMQDNLDACHIRTVQTYNDLLFIWKDNPQMSMRISEDFSAFQNNVSNNLAAIEKEKYRLSKKYEKLKEKTAFLKREQNDKQKPSKVKGRPIITDD